MVKQQLYLHLFCLSPIFISVRNFVVEQYFLLLPYAGFFEVHILAHAFIMLYLERELGHHDFDLIWIDACQFTCVGFRPLMSIGVNEE